MAIRRLLLRSGHSLELWKKLDVPRVLDAHPALREVYLAKEALHRLYRTRGIDRATLALDKLLHRLAASALPELATLRRTTHQVARRGPSRARGSLGNQRAPRSITVTNRSLS